MGNKNSIITLEDEQGNVKEYEVFFTFDSDETKKSYVVYTDKEKEDGMDIVYAYYYDKTGKDKELKPIETEEEWNTIEAIISKLEDDRNEK